MSTTSAGSPEAGTRAAWSVRRWIAVNAAGIGAAFGLFGLLGGTVEALGADHDSLVRDLSLLVAFAIGGSVWAALRGRALLPAVPRATRVGIVAVVALAGGFLTGYVVSGPPLDFILGITAIGAVAGAVEWRILREHLVRPGRMAVIGAAGWLVASVVAIVPAALLGDTIDAALGSGVAGFVGVLVTIGLVGGAAGGAVEALALRQRLTTG